MTKIIESRLYKIYRHILDRCYDPACESYKYYGGKLITVCDEWMLDRDNFIKWSIDNGYELGLTINRRDSKNEYSPSNCEWISHKKNSSRLLSTNLDDSTRKCYGCGLWKPLTLENFYKSGEPGRYGFRNLCRECNKIKSKKDWQRVKSGVKAGKIKSPFSSEEKTSISDRYLSGESILRLSQEFKIGRSTVRKYLKQLDTYGNCSAKVRRELKVGCIDTLNI